MMKIIYLPTSGFNPHRHMQAGMIHKSTEDATVACVCAPQCVLSPMACLSIIWSCA